MFRRMHCLILGLWLMPFCMLASTPATQAQAPPPDASVPLLEGTLTTIPFQSPRLLKLPPLNCAGGSAESRATQHRPECEAADAQLNGVEGWVILSMMVDTHGKPFEVAVSESTGNPVFEKAALSNAESMELQPATQNGQPVESVFQFKYVYVTPGATGANPAFIRNYGIFQTAITAQDRTAADQALKTLKVTNLYEDAYLGVAAYQYARLWGTKYEQRAGLARAIANDDRGHYLPPALHQGILFAFFNLNVKDHLYAEANLTAEKLQKLKLDDNTAQALAEMVGRIKKIETDGSSYDVQGEIMDSGYNSWHILLYRHHFRISIQQGNLSQVKLRCQKHFVSFDFRPELQYDYSKTDGVCHIELIGSPGSRFTLTQFGDN
jgi:TonB family protein